MTEKDMRATLEKMPKEELIKQLLLKNETIVKLSRKLDEIENN